MTQPEFFDTHAHLDFPDFAGEIDQVVARAEAAGIVRIITIGTTLEGSLKSVELAERFPQVYAAIGWHPSNVTSAPSELPQEIRALASHPKVVAIGETGLDFSRLPSGSGGTAEEDARYKTRQTTLFQQQLAMAVENNLNVIIHQRDASRETLSVLRPYASKLRAVFHCFVGTPEVQEQIAALGHLVSFTGIATFKNGAQVRETVRATPIESFMLETDCPYLAPVPHRGKRCEPSFVADTAAFIAQEKSCSLEALSRATCETARSFFPRLS